MNKRAREIIFWIMEKRDYQETCTINDLIENSRYRNERFAMIWRESRIFFWKTSRSRFSFVSMESSSCKRIPMPSAPCWDRMIFIPSS